MHIRTIGTARIKDRESGQIYEIEADELDWDVVGGNERQMGPETEWQAETNHAALGNLVWKLWEYPAGMENYQGQELDGHELIENFDISLEHDPAEPDEFDDPFYVASRALAAGREPIFGSAQEQLQRQDVLDVLAMIDVEAAATVAEHGGVGHNNPPSDERFTHDELREMRELMRSIQTELQKPQPDAPKVIEAASTMRRIGQWVLARITKGADAFADTVGKAGGAVAIAYLTVADPATLWAQIMQIVNKICIWLLTAMGM
jgi:hypothetical protein